jgi:hypothetical protein
VSKERTILDKKVSPCQTSYQKWFSWRTLHGLKHRLLPPAVKKDKRAALSLAARLSSVPVLRGTLKDPLAFRPTLTDGLALSDFSIVKHSNTFVKRITTAADWCVSFRKQPLLRGVANFSPCEDSSWFGEPSPLGGFGATFLSWLSFPCPRHNEQVQAHGPHNLWARSRADALYPAWEDRGPE